MGVVDYRQQHHNAGAAVGQRRQLDDGVAAVAVDARDKVHHSRPRQPLLQLHVGKGAAVETGDGHTRGLRIGDDLGPHRRHRDFEPAAHTHVDVVDDGA